MRIPRIIVTIASLAAIALCANGQIAPEDTIVLPVELAAGKSATLAVVGANGRVASGVAIGLSDGEQLKTDESGRAHFLAPSEAGILIARISGEEIRAAADVVKQPSAVLQIAGLPAIASLKNRIVIRGSGFEGDADHNDVTVGGQRALVLAASPFELIALASPDAPAGASQIAISSGDQKTSAPIQLVDVVSEAGQRSVAPGKKMEIGLTVLGTTRPLELQLRNESPEIVRFQHGSSQRIRTRGGEVNSATLEVKGLRAGSYSYAISLAPRAGLTNVPVTIDLLQAAEKFAPPNFQKRLEKILKKLKRETPDVSGARKEFAKLSTVKSSGDYSAFLEAARKELFGE
jgi:hypothetical protein